MTDSFRLIFLGTGAAAPSASRSLPALAIKKENRIVLCDCGEGTQMQIRRAGLSPSKIHSILISHLHGDHVLDLPGFISTQQLMGRTSPLTIYGPPGTKQFLDCMSLVSKFSPEFPFKIVELEPHYPQFFSIPGFSVTAQYLDHGAPCLGFRLQEQNKPGAFNAAKADALGIPLGIERAALQRGKSILHNGREIRAEEIVGPMQPGRVISYCTDTRPCDAGLALAANCDVLVHDATFSDAFEEYAEPTKHSTGREAAILARTAGAKMLVLWHLSIRLHGEEEACLLSQAKAEFVHSALFDDLAHLDVQRPGARDEL